MKYVNDILLKLYKNLRNRGNIDIHITHMHDPHFPRLVQALSLQSGGVELV